MSSQVTNNNLELSQEEGNINFDPDQDSDLDHYLVRPDGLQRNAVVNISNKMKYGKEIHVVMRYVNKMHPVRN